jgi:hypothetical protein
MHNHHAVAGEVHIELQPVRAEREPVIEGGDCILRPEGRTAAVRIDEGPVYAGQRAYCSARSPDASM